MGANELANRTEAVCWVRAGAAGVTEGGVPVVQESDFFFRNLVGFLDKIEVLTPDLGTDWDQADDLVLALFLERAYSRREASVFCKNIDAFGLNPDGVVTPIATLTSPGVLPISRAGYESLFLAGNPAELDFFSVWEVLVIRAALSDIQEQDGGYGLEFCVEVVRTPLNQDQQTDVSFPIPP